MDPKTPPAADQPRLYQRAPDEPTLSLCMMVKNEEKLLPTALASAAGWVDEIIVVDTGSTDRTVQIAESFGAKVYHHRWENDFAKHRNQTLSYATGDWILILDADEELDQKTAPIIRQAIKDPRFDAYLVELINQVASGATTFLLHARIFRNHKGFHYEGKVHNRPIVTGPSTQIPVKLYHYGYALDQETMEAKHQRRLEMIRQWVQSEPDNYLSHSYLAQTLAASKETEVEAVDEGLIAVDLIRRAGVGAEQFPRAYYPVLMCLANLGRDDEVIKHSLDCLAAVPYYPDPHFFLTWAYYRQTRWQDVLQEVRRFIEAQEYAAQHPEKFIYIENMTLEQTKWVYMRWVMSAVHLQKNDEAAEAFERLLAEDDCEVVVKMVLQDLLSQGFLAQARTMAELARRDRPQWDWHDRYTAALAAAESQSTSGDLRRQAGEALQAGDLATAADKFRQGVRAAPTDVETLLGLARSLDGQGRTDEAVDCYMQALCGGSGHDWAWRRLVEIYQQAGNLAGAEALQARVAAMVTNDPQAAATLAEMRRRLAQDPPGPCVAQRPPRLVVFLVPGLSPDMVRVAAPHLLMHTAWGELIQPPEVGAASAPAWATIYTGKTPQAHGITQDPPPGQPLGLNQLKTPSVWEIMAQDLRVGLMSIPLGCPPPSVNGWAVAGYPGGLLRPGLVHPAELAPRVLAGGFRPDYLAGPQEEFSYCRGMERDYSQEAGLYQIERNRITTAMALPAVDVLVIGLWTVERVQNCFGLDPSNFRTGAYQQVYSCLEALVAALRPANYAVLSQRGCGSEPAEHRPGGFYCLSWLRGEGGKARATDIAEQLLQCLGSQTAP